MERQISQFLPGRSPLLRVGLTWPPEVPFQRGRRRQTVYAGQGNSKRPVTSTIQEGYGFRQGSPFDKRHKSLINPHPSLQRGPDGRCASRYSIYLEAGLPWDWVGFSLRPLDRRLRGEPRPAPLALTYMGGHAYVRHHPTIPAYISAMGKIDIETFESWERGRIDSPRMFHNHPGLTYPYPLLYIDCFLPDATQEYLFVRQMGQKWPYTLYADDEGARDHDGFHGNLPTEMRRPEDHEAPLGFADYVTKFRVRMERIESIRSQRRAALMALPGADLHDEVDSEGRPWDHVELDFYKSGPPNTHLSGSELDFETEV